MTAWRNGGKVFPVGLVARGTVAQLRAMTSSQVSVGDLADATDAGPLRCYAATGTGSSWEALVTYRVPCNASSTSTALRYLDLSGGTAENSVLTQPYNQHQPGSAFRVEAVRVAAHLDPGSTIIGIHKNGNTTAEDTGTTDPGAAQTWWEETFAVEFAAGDTLAVSYDPVTGSNVAGFVVCRTLHPE